MRIRSPQAVPASLPVEPVGEEVDAVRPTGPVGLLEEVGPELEIRAVLLPPGELVVPLIGLAGLVDCDCLYAALVSFRPDMLLAIAESTGLRPLR